LYPILILLYLEIYLNFIISLGLEEEEILKMQYECVKTENKVVFGFGFLCSDGVQHKDDFVFGSICSFSFPSQELGNYFHLEQC
jgi:hypothetical protein